MEWNEIERKAGRIGVSPQMVLREEVQKGILASMSLLGAFRYLIFQGGTASRLFYGNPRFSEDLDFVLREGEDFELHAIKEDIERQLSLDFHYIPEVDVYVQKKGNGMCRMLLKTRSEELAQRLVINIELFRVPSYLNSSLIMEYPPLNPVVRVEDREEMLADKLIAISLRRYLKGRDIWDIHYLHKLGIEAPAELIVKKGRDYGEEDIAKKMDEARKRLEKRGIPALKKELARFLPPSHYLQIKGSLEEVISTVISLLEIFVRRIEDEVE